MGIMNPRPQASLRQHLFARFWGIAAGPVNRTLAPTKRGLFADLPREVVEIGPGVGSNFAYYAPGTTVRAFEPNPSMHDKLRAEASARRVHLDLSTLDLRNAAIPSDSVEAVVSTLVLCSAEDATNLVKDIHRILRPGRAFLFLEHVAPAPGTGAHAVARMVRRPWALLGDNCNVMAPTVDAIAAAGFSSVDANLDNFGGRLDPSGRHYYGVAMK